MTNRRIQTFLPLLLIIGTQSMGQCGEVNKLGLKSNQSSKRGSGSASRLAGSTLIYQIFVADEKSDWSENQKNEAIEKIRSSISFIAGQARRYNVPLQFKADVNTKVARIDNAPTATFVDPRWTERAIEAGSGLSGNQLVDELRVLHQVDSVVICLHVNKPALSYNLAHYTDVDDTYQSERMICFTRYPDARQTASATYAHEILHLFGAGDLYFPYDRRADRKNLARRYFPDDIMRRVDYDMQQLTIGAFTAFRIGWLETIKPEHRMFEDQG